MKKPHPLHLLFFALLFVAGCQTAAKDKNAGDSADYTAQKEHISGLISKIAFGSCGEQFKPQPILNLAADQKPDLFIWLGDNIYGDTYEMDTLRAKYDQLAAKAEFQRLKSTTPFIATWDDHDYGWNDSGRHYPYKEQSKDIFMKFWDAPQSDIRYGRPGIYTSYYYENKDRTLQVIMLDTRTFRDALRSYQGEKVDTSQFNYTLDYFPYDTADSTLLGAAQWAWLEQQLQVPADIRIIGSSTQFGITYNGYEAWANLPHEQQRFLDLIKKTNANGVLFISGDVHYAELSKLEEEGLYPIYDLTASGITSTWGFSTPNENRIAGAVMENHFGMLDINWQEKDPSINLKIMDVSGKIRIDKTINLSELQLKMNK